MTQPGTTDTAAALSSATVTDDIDVCLDIFGQQPRLDIHTQVCLCYALPEDTAIQPLLATLTDGLKRLTASFPWAAGQVVNEGSHADSSGIFKIKSLEKAPHFTFKDLRAQPLAPTWDQLRTSRFSMELLDESIFAPRSTIPLGAEPTGVKAVSPVFMVQATLLSGGLVLTFLGQHQCMDIAGQAELMRLLSKVCRGEAFTADELSLGNVERRDIIPLLENHIQAPKLTEHLTQRAVQPDEGAGQTHRQCCWSSFAVSSASLASLKNMAMTGLPPGSSFVSTDDAISAFLWQCVMRARSSRLRPETPSTFARAVDARKFVGIPDKYMGLVQNMSYTTYTLSDLTSLPLGHIASSLRRAVDPRSSDLPVHTRALATYLYTNQDKSDVSPTGSLNPPADVILSSWAKTDCYDFDFGLGLGAPEAVRRPRFTPFESLGYLLPRRQDGEIGIALCLRSDDMDKLKADELFRKYVK